MHAHRLFTEVSTLNQSSLRVLFEGTEKDSMEWSTNGQKWSCATLVAHHPHCYCSLGSSTHRRIHNSEEQSDSWLDNLHLHLLCFSLMHMSSLPLTPTQWPTSPIWQHHTSLIPNSLAVLFSTTLLSVVNYYCTVSHSPGSYQPEPLSYKAHWENTFIPASRAMSDYLLDLEYVQS